MNDKLKTYYCCVDIYNINKKNLILYDESDSDEIQLFKHFFPINMSMLMRYLENIIYEICKKFVHKESVEKEINDLRNDSKVNNFKDYKWKNVSLRQLFKGDFNYLTEKFILNNQDVPDYNSFVNQYCFPKTDYIYNFSIKELYNMLLERGINVTINNYYIQNKIE